MFRGKHLWGLQAYNYIKTRFQQRCFTVNIAKFLRTAFSIENLLTRLTWTYVTIRQRTITFKIRENLVINLGFGNKGENNLLRRDIWFFSCFLESRFYANLYLPAFIFLKNCWSYNLFHATGFFVCPWKRQKKNKQKMKGHVEVY